MDDMDALFELYGHPAITRFVEPLFDREEEIEYQHSYIRYVYDVMGYGMWAVEDRESGELIGRIGVEGDPENPSDEVELGYVVAVSRQGRGIAYEVCTAVLDYAEHTLGKREVYARIHPDNLPSIRLAEKLGFHRTDEMVGGEVVWRLHKG